MNSKVHKEKSWAQWDGLVAKVLTLKAQGSHVGAGSNPSRPASHPALCLAWESSRTWLKALGPCTLVGDLEDSPGSWLRIGAAPAIAVTWGVNHRTEDLSLCLSSSLYI